jgi:hypothetical protein
MPTNKDMSTQNLDDGLQLLTQFLKVIKKRLVLIIITITLSVVGVYLFNFFTKPMVKCEMVIKSQLLDNVKLANLVSSFKHSNYQSNISTNIVSVNGTLEIISSAQMGDTRGAKSDNESVKVEVKLQTNKDIKKIENTILEYLELTTYIKDRVKINNENDKRIYNSLDVELDYLSKVKSILLTKINSSNSISIPELAEINLAIIELEEKKAIYSFRKEFNTGIEVVKPMIIISDFQSKMRIQNLLIGLILGIFFATVLVILLELRLLLKNEQ